MHKEEIGEDNPAVVDSPAVGSLEADIPEEDILAVDTPQADNLKIKVV